MATSRSVSSGFYVLVTGQIDGCQMQGYDNLYVKYSFNKGHDWSVLAGVEHGVSQISKRSAGSSSDVMTWNYPIDIMFRSSNVHGWPQIVIGVYGLTIFGGDVIRGYGCTHIPTIPGRHTKYIQLYTPVSSSLCQRLTAWITNNPPEFFDSKFVAQGKGREVTRVKSHGCVKVTFNVTTKNMSEWGYQVGHERMGDMLTAQAQLNSSHVNAMLADGAGSRPGTAQQQPQIGPAKTNLSASTAAALANQRNRASAASTAGLGINPPSGQNSRESSVIRRGGGGGAGGGIASSASLLDSSSEDVEAKYPTGSTLSQRSSPALRATSLAATGTGVEMQPITAPRAGQRQF